MPAAIADLPPQVKGALWMMASAGILTVMGALVRHIAQTLPPSELVFFRALLGIPFMIPWLLRNGAAGLHTRNHRLYVLRAFCTLIAMTCFFTALSLNTLEQVTAILFTRPLFATVAAIFILGELVGARRWSAMAIGFCGVLIIVRPGFEEINIGSLFALGSASFAGLNAVIVRRIARNDMPDTITIYYMFYVTPVALIPALIVWVTPTWYELALVLVMAGLGAAGQRTMARALKAGDIAFVMPFDFTRLPFAAVIGLVLFGDIPVIWSWIGSMVIFGASYYIARRETRLRRAQVPKPPADPE